jgi:hypothetical protein
MRGNVEQRGGNRWRLRVFAGRENGRPKLVTRSFQGTERQAETALAKLVTEVEQGQVAKHHPATLADLLHQWLEAVAPKRSAHTMKEYGRMAATNIKPAIGAVPLPRLAGAGSTRSTGRSPTGAVPWVGAPQPLPAARRARSSPQVEHGAVQPGRPGNAARAQPFDSFSAGRRRRPTLDRGDREQPTVALRDGPSDVAAPLGKLTTVRHLGILGHMWVPNTRLRRWPGLVRRPADVLPPAVLPHVGPGSLVEYMVRARSTPSLVGAPDGVFGTYRRSALPARCDDDMSPDDAVPTRELGAFGWPQYYLGACHLGGGVPVAGSPSSSATVASGASRIASWAVGRSLTCHSGSASRRMRSSAKGVPSHPEQ